MKKNILSIIAIVAAFTFALPSMAQLKIGLKGGLNLTNVTLSDRVNPQYNFRTNNRAGFFVGPTADITLPVVGLGIDASILYNNKVISIEEDKKTLHYIDVPINAKYTIGFSSLASIYFATGPQFSYNVGDRNWTTRGINYGWELNQSEFSWNVGAGVTALSHLRVGYNYNIGLGSTKERRESLVSPETIKLKNNTHQVSVTYFF